MNFENIVNGLKELGFTEYEAKVYIALLRSHPSNGNVIATLSGVPAPKVYETLRKMQEREVVTAVSGGEKGNKIAYIPIPYSDLLNEKKKAFASNVSFLEDELEKVSTLSDTNWTELFMIHGYNASMNSIQSAIEQATSEILMIGWCQELEGLLNALETAFSRNIRIVTLTFDQCELEIPWKNYIHYQFDSALTRHKGELCVVVDYEKAIIFQAVNDEEGPHAVISSHPSTVMTTYNYIRHDLILNRITQDFEKEIKQRYGADFMLNTYDL